jgi:hypothetical protein
VVRDEALNDQKPRHSTENLVFGLAVWVWMIPIDAVGMIIRDAPAIVEAVRALDVHSLGVSGVLADLHIERRDEHVDVVGRLHRRNGHAVIVQIRHLGHFDFETSAAGLVDKLQLKLVPPLSSGARGECTCRYRHW